ncbi:unnamed protein product [Parnassius apollo]|uniref:(apollo) hypothetical protein n=1 Tax=Parnassius apollo TaxID=110799 RepID=A0A8S3WVU7_PARAO|nr:unnamed protein product [Parnassius apollo]
MERLSSIFCIDFEDRSTPGGPFQDSVLRLAVCIPRACTTKEAISALLFNVSARGFEYKDYYCRLPNDKQWVPANNCSSHINNN